MCNLLPAHIPGYCPHLRWDDLPWAPPIWKQPQPDPAWDELLEAMRVEEVKGRYPPGPWPFQRAETKR